MENIKELKEYPNYLIFSDGKVFSKKTGKYLSQFLDNHGYLRVTLSFNGTYSPVLVHRLVAKAFVKNKTNALTVNHIDENKLNNDFSNLEWLSNRDNVNYGTAHKRSGKTRRKKIMGVSKDGKEVSFCSVYDAEENGYGKARTILQAIRKQYFSGGFMWRYA